MLKTVKKPWGSEEWLEVNDRYVIKHLNIKRGGQLSLQYHERKLETLMLQEGRVWIEFYRGAYLIRQDMKKKELYTLKPKETHRLTGKRKAVILEVSTPELDDVVRLEDKYGRIKKRC